MGGASGYGQSGGNMSGQMGGQSPFNAAFSPKGGMGMAVNQPNPLSGGEMSGGNMYGAMGGQPPRYGAQTPPQSALLTGDYGSSGGNMLGSMGGAPRMGGDSFDYGPMEAEMRARDKFNMVGQPVQWGGGAMGKIGAQPVKPPGAAPAPTTVDHMANFQKLYAEDPRLANEYRLRSGDTIGWWQNNGQNQALQGMFGGNQDAMNSWVNSTSPQSSNAAPLTQAEMMRLNQMAGIKGPSWLR